MNDNKFWGKARYWVAQKRMEVVSIGSGLLVLFLIFVISSYSDYQKQSKIKAEEEQKIASARTLLTDSINSNTNANWLKIYSESTLNEYKGGVYIEKHMFSDDKIALKPSTTSYSSRSYYIDTNSIKTISPDIREANFRDDENEKGTRYKVTGYQINCSANTLREIRHYWVSITEPHSQTLINQQTGEKNSYNFPGHMEVVNPSNSERTWYSIGSDPNTKYREALCTGDYTPTSKANFNRY